MTKAEATQVVSVLQEIVKSLDQILNRLDHSKTNDERIRPYLRQSRREVNVDEA